MVRRRKYYKKSTNVIKMKFQSFMDVSTTDSSMQIITVSAGGKELLRRLAPQFSAYKYYKIGNVAVKLVPASTLPVDPSGLSYEAGENQVDPRDQLTPGMMRITNGEDIFEDLSGLTDDQQHGIYNNMLLDPRWFKWMLQSGVKRHATPRFWTIGQLHQDKWPGMNMNYPVVDANNNITGTAHYQNTINSASGALAPQYFFGSSAYGFFQTGHTGRLGWMPTDGMTVYGSSEKALLTSPPEVEVMKIILPKAYSTRYFYRMFITETVYFREPIVNFGIATPSGGVYRPLDVFHTPGFPMPYLPDSSQPITPGNNYTGGNYGDN